ncbi:MAG TPA: hypothetical protein VEW93_04005 [Acidimicrobiales bacterium]|nr:hypothetical protein [Acidimicrobiales bacterium]
MTAGHLVRRFVGSLAPGTVAGDDLAWVDGQLTEREGELWRSMPRADRRHSLAVARRVQAALGAEATRPVLAAALLHDVGKVASGLGTYGRVMATLSGAVAGRDMAEAWSQTRGVTRRIGLYLRHEELGADMLELDGSEPLTVALVREHSWPDDERSVPGHLADALRAADDA